MFWSDCTDFKIIERADIITMLIGLLFGAIHCVAWPFSSTLWRFSSAAMIVITANVLFGASAVAIKAEQEQKPISSQTIRVLIFCAFLYIFARVITLTLAFTTLRSLPAAAYETVQWTAFIPHV
jgi:hypothetical protein